MTYSKEPLVALDDEAIGAGSEELLSAPATILDGVSNLAVYRHRLKSTPNKIL